MVVLAFYALFFLATSQISFQSPIQDALVNNDELEQVKLFSFETSQTPTNKIPITGLTTVTRTRSANRRDGLEQETYTTDHPTTTKTHSLSSITPSLTSASIPVPTKNLKNCNVEGIPTNYLVSNILNLLYARDAYSCQLQCMSISRCESYSWQIPVATESNNCVFYSTLIDGDMKVKLSSTSGIFFSDKYPSDDSNFCYGNTSL